MDFLDSNHVISKFLSATDLGFSGSHQSGILIPKNNSILSFFPVLEKFEKNPRVKLLFKDECGKIWSFSYIYYNNRFFGGTRNEYRLTCMTSFIKQNDLQIGDEVIFSKTVDGDRRILCRHKDSELVIKKGEIRLSKDWKIIKIKEN